LSNPIIPANRMNASLPFPSLLLGICLLLQTPAAGQEPKASPKESSAVSADTETDSPEQKVKALRQEVDKVEAAYLKAFTDRKEGEPEDTVNRLWDAYCKVADQQIPEILKLVRQNPGSAWAFDALEWIAMHARNAYHPYGMEALEVLTAHHAANPKIGKTCAVVGYYWKEKTPTLDLLRAVVAKNQDSITQGQAHLALARTINALSSINAYTNEFPQQEIELLLEKTISVYGNLPDLRTVGLVKAGKFLKSDATQELFEIRHLSVGGVALEIEGLDGQGRKLKLSDYRGKVVVLVFWGTWCGPCMAMVPHERELVKRLEGEPFALIGVNDDEEKSVMIRAMKKERMTWPSFWNGEKPGAESITTKWNVRSWPMVYVLDAKGIIRYKDVRGKSMDAAVDALLKELKAVKK
jgi:thiol-disulfide isomerase/thioredoxin